MSVPIYLDSHATTFVEPRVLESMLPFLREQGGNPSNPEHHHGGAARDAVEQSRQSVAACLGCSSPEDILFTCGTTEANNLALIGAYLQAAAPEAHFISSVIEHASVQAPLEYLQSLGARVTWVPVDSEGRVNPADIQSALRPETLMVSIMAANNEIGTIQPLEEIGAICRAAKVLFHSDAAQFVGHEVLDVEKIQADLLTFSAHKFYGPKGVGALYRRTTPEAVRLRPVMHGGGQEGSLRSGTLNVAGIVGMATALRIGTEELAEENRRLMALATAIVARLKQACPGLRLNGSTRHKLSRNISLTIPGVDSSALIQLLKDRISFSAGSACSSAKPEPSHVLRAIGLSDEECYQTIRLGLGRGVLAADVADILADGIAAAPIFSPSRNGWSGAMY